MEFVLLFVLQVFLLFLLSHELTKSLSHALFKITKSRTFTVYVLAFLFFPGVVVHELAHLIVASVLFVKTGHVEFVPKLGTSEVKLGSVEIAKTDPLRRFFIGASPILVGLFIIGGSFIYLQMLSFDLLWQKILFCYVLFVIGNTMYSSKKDMEGAIELFLTLGILFAISYFLGFRISLPAVNPSFIEQIIEITKRLDVLLLIPLGIDLGVIAVTKLIGK